MSLSAQQDLAVALQRVTGVLSACVLAHGISERESYRFTGEWAGFGAMTIGEALDLADATLGACKQEISA